MRYFVRCNQKWCSSGTYAELHDAVGCWNCTCPEQPVKKSAAILYAAGFTTLTRKACCKE